MIQWSDHDDHSRAIRAGDPIDSRDQIPAERWAALQTAHEALCDDHAALIVLHDQRLTAHDRLIAERDAWRAKAADLNNRLDRAEAALRQIAWGHLSWAVGGAAFAAIVCTVLFIWIGR